MKEMLKRLEKWFDLNLGWFFVNGNRQEDWAKQLREKYGK